MVLFLLGLIFSESIMVPPCLLHTNNDMLENKNNQNMHQQHEYKTKTLHSIMGQFIILNSSRYH